MAVSVLHLLLELLLHTWLLLLTIIIITTCHHWRVSFASWRLCWPLLFPASQCFTAGFPTQWFHSFVAGSNNSFYRYLFGPSSPACCPAASCSARSPASARSPTPAAGATQVSKIDLQLRCDVICWFAEVVVTGLVRGTLLVRTMLEFTWVNEEVYMRFFVTLSLCNIFIFLLTY